MKRIWIFVLFLLLFLACADVKNPVAPDVFDIVIQGYLYAYKPVRDIKITTPAQPGKPETQYPINDARVILSKNGLDYNLSLSPGDSGYYSYSGQELTVQPGDSFELKVLYNGKTAHAITLVPNTPKITLVSRDTLWADRETVVSDSNKITVKWESPDNSNAYFFTDIKPHSRFPWDDFESPSNIHRHVSFEEKWKSHEYTITVYKSTFGGEYLFIIYQINREYVDFLMNDVYIDGKRKKPFSNIENGYGIFTAFNSDSCLFYVMGRLN